MNFFVHRNFKRNWTHMDAYEQGQGYYLIEVGSWTLEVEIEANLSKVGDWFSRNKLWIVPAAILPALCAVIQPEAQLSPEHAWEALRYMEYAFYRNN